MSTSSPAKEGARFRAFPQFNDPGHAALARNKHRLGSAARPLFTSERPLDVLARRLCDEGLLSIKELLESAEFWSRTRRRLRRPVIADLCCGHGLTGLLFALMERRVEQVFLVDRNQSSTAERLLEVLVAEGPWVAEKVTWVRKPLADAHGLLPAGCAVAAVHACGKRTDDCIGVGLALGGPLAVMPCCIHKAVETGPKAVRAALGAELASAVHRSYRLEAAGRSLDWSEIPSAVTPMNRILVSPVSV